MLFDNRGKELRRKVGFLGGFREVERETPRVELIASQTSGPDTYWPLEECKEQKHSPHD